MSPSEFAAVARYLRSLGPPDESGRKRSAISRYYYAAFLECRDRIIASRAKPFRNHGVHDAVLKSLEYSGDRQLAVIGKGLRRLKKLREDADYVLGVEPKPADVGEAESLWQELTTKIGTANLSACYSDPSM